MKFLTTLLAMLLVTSAYAQELAVVLEGKKFGYIDRSGQLVIPAQYDRAQPFSDGLAAVAVGKSWGFIDMSGNMVIEPQFSNAKNFNDGLCLVNKDKAWIYIDKTGATKTM